MNRSPACANGTCDDGSREHPGTASRGPADAALVRRIRAGDPTAVDDLYERFRRPAFALARRILADDVLAEDVLQDVFLSVWRDPGRSTRPRQRRLVAAGDGAPQGGRRRPPRGVAAAPAGAGRGRAGPGRADRGSRRGGRRAWTRVVSERVRTALGVLPAPQREALTLAYYGGYTQREVAALTGAPLGTVKTRMLAGMRRLKEELGGRSPAMTGGALGGAAPVDGEPVSGERAAARRPRRLRRARRRLGAARPRAGGRGALRPRTCPDCARCARTVAETPTSWRRWPPTCPQAEPSRSCATGCARRSSAPSRCRPEPDGPRPGAELDAGARRRRAGPAPCRRSSPVRAGRPGAAAAALAPGAARRARGRRGGAILGLGLWNVVLASDRRRLQSTVAEQNAVMTAAAARAGRRSPR
jgi:DNA-directed RNA polymerase specialized sigma24 family protein